MAQIDKAASIGSQTSLNAVLERLRSNNRRLASGQRIAVAADDPSGLAQSERLRAQISSLSRSSRNAQDGISLTQTADGGLSELSNLTGRLKELTVQAGNGTLSADDKQIIQQEADQILEQIDQTAASTEFNDIGLLDGSQSKIDVDGGEGADIGVETSDSSAAALGLTSIDLAGDNAGASQQIDQAISAIAERRARLGATENRLRHTVSELDNRVEQLTGAESRIRDLDVAKETSLRTANLIKRDFAVGIHAQTSLQPKVFLNLLNKP